MTSQRTRGITRWECPVHGPDFGLPSGSATGKRWCQHCRIPASELVEVRYVPLQGDRTMSERERDAIELLDRIYGRKAGHQLSDSGMFEEWIDGEIMAFIRKHGSFPDQLREMDRG